MVYDDGRYSIKILKNSIEITERVDTWNDYKLVNVASFGVSREVSEIFEKVIKEANNYQAIKRLLS